MKYLVLFFMCQCAIAQTVSTFFESGTQDIDDGLVFDADGNLYGSNFDGDTVYKITPDGVASPFVSGLQNPNGLAFDGDGNLFVCEYSAQRINKYDSDGVLLDQFPTGGLTSGILRSFDGTAMIYTNLTNDSVNRLDANGAITILYEGAPLNDPVGLAYDDQGGLYVGNFSDREIYKLIGNAADFIATVPADGATGNAFLGFIAYAGDSLYGTSFGAHKIYKINPNGFDEVTLFAGDTQGETDGSISEALFDTPNGIVFNPADASLYISQFNGEGNVRKIEGFQLGINDNVSKVLTVYPNPTSEKLVLTTLENTAGLGYKIHSVLGTLVQEGKIASDQSVSIIPLQSGSYFLEVVHQDASKTLTQFVKL